MKNGTRKKLALLLAAGMAGVSFISGTAKADLKDCGVDLDKAGLTQPWAILALQSGVVVNDHRRNDLDVFGNIGAAGAGNVKLLTHTFVNGDVYYHQPGTLKLTGDSSISGATFHDAASDALLDEARQDAIDASVAASALAPTRGETNINLRKNQSIILSGTGCVVLSLQDFRLRKNSTLTLDGDADTSFIINVSGKFSIKSAEVLLTGGLLAPNVLFNLTGTRVAAIGGTSNVSGRILGIDRLVSLKQKATVHGELIGKKVVLSGDATVLSP